MATRMQLRCGAYIAALTIAAVLSAGMVIPIVWAQGIAQGQVRVAHLAPDVPALSVWIDGEQALDHLPFATVSEYVSLAAGLLHHVQLRAAESDEIASELTLTVEPSGALTIVLTPGPRTLVLTDDLSVETAKAKLRVVPALVRPNVPALDVAVQGEAGLSLLIQGLGVGQASAYLALDPGAYTLEIRRAGGETRALLRLQGVQLDVKTANTLFVFEGSQGQVQGLLLVDAEAKSKLSPGVWLGLLLWALLLARFVFVHLAP